MRPPVKALLAALGGLAVACGQGPEPSPSDPRERDGGRRSGPAPQREAGTDAYAGEPEEPGPICNGVELFDVGCAGGVCHHSGDGPAQGLDLQSPGAQDRLVGVPSTCNGRLYIDPAAPEQSFLLEKLTEEEPECGGSRMPFNGELTEAQIACVREWILTVAADRMP